MFWASYDPRRVLEYPNIRYNSENILSMETTHSWSLLYMATTWCLKKIHCTRNSTKSRNVFKHLSHPIWIRDIPICWHLSIPWSSIIPTGLLPWSVLLSSMRQVPTFEFAVTFKLFHFLRISSLPCGYNKQHWP